MSSLINANRLWQIKMRAKNDNCHGLRRKAGLRMRSTRKLRERKCAKSVCRAKKSGLRKGSRQHAILHTSNRLGRGGFKFVLAYEKVISPLFPGIHKYFCLWNSMTSVALGIRSHKCYQFQMQSMTIAVSCSVE